MTRPESSEPLERPQGDGIAPAGPRQGAYRVPPLMVGAGTAGAGERLTAGLPRPVTDLMRWLNVHRPYTMVGGSRQPVPLWQMEIAVVVAVSREAVEAYLAVFGHAPGDADVIANLSVYPGVDLAALAPYFSPSFL